MNSLVHFGEGYSLFKPGRRASSGLISDQGSGSTPKESNSVELGEPETLYFGDKTSFEELLEYPDLVTYILETHTFIQGKIGFYEQILAQLLAKEKERDNEEGEHASKYVYTIQHLPRKAEYKREYKRLIILPRESSPEAVNRLIAKGLNQEIPIWLVAHPLFVYPHLLMSFHNLFIIVNSPEELKTVQQVLNLPKKIVSTLQKSPIPQALFVTDFDRVAKSSGELVAAARLEIEL